MNGMWDISVDVHHCVMITMPICLKLEKITTKTMNKIRTHTKVPTAPPLASLMTYRHALAVFAMCQYPSSEEKLKCYSLWQVNQTHNVREH